MPASSPHHSAIPQVAYFVNHPLYTPPPTRRAVIALAAAMLCQFANFR